MSRYFINLCYLPPMVLNIPSSLGDGWDAPKLLWLICLNLCICWNFSFLSNSWDPIFPMLFHLFFLHASFYGSSLSFKSWLFLSLWPFSLYMLKSSWSSILCFSGPRIPAISFPDYLSFHYYLCFYWSQGAIGNNKE